MVERISGIMDGRRVPLGSEPPEIAGAERGWAGFAFESHVVGPSREEVNWSWHSSHIGMCVKGSGGIAVNGDAGDHRFRLVPGKVTLFPGGLGNTTIRQFDGRCRVVVAELDAARLAQYFPEVERLCDSDLATVVGGDDPQIASLLNAMLVEIDAGCPSGPLYAQSLSLALSACVAAHYGSASTAERLTNDGLSVGQRARTVDYIMAHFDQKILLTELADNLGVSPRHFMRLFQKTFGVTPHAYLTTLRVQHAKKLLTETPLSIAEVAFDLGFKSQSHFTDIFHKKTGTTPVRYRHQH